MTRESHQIRLAGPWEVSLTVEGEKEVASFHVIIRNPFDWTNSLGDRPITGVLRIERRFNWTFPEPPPRVVELRIGGLSQRPAAAELNGVQLKIADSGHEPNESVVEMTGLLKNSNRLALVFELSGLDPTKALLNTVFISITGP